MSSNEQTTISQAIEAIDETIASAQKIRAALLSKQWIVSFQLVVEFGIDATQAISFVSAAAATAAGLEVMQQRHNQPST